IASSSATGIRYALATDTLIVVNASPRALVKKVGIQVLRPKKVATRHAWHSAISQNAGAARKRRFDGPDSRGAVRFSSTYRRSAGSTQREPAGSSGANQ